MEERFETKQQELRFLSKEYKTNPGLFEQPAYVEDAEALSEFGIFIPGKESCAPGLLKLWPEDFIVEEQLDGKEAGISGDTSKPGEGPTVYATLVKCGVSTIEAVEDIAKILGIRVEDIAYAGIKDKDAITAQTLSLRRTSPSRAAAVRTPHFYLKDITSGNGAVGKGSLAANRFTIIVRTNREFFGESEAAVFTKKLQALQEFGFYNFYYLQRFGTPRLHNFAWARLILRGEYEAAVRDILSFEGPRELPYFRATRRTLGTLFGKWDEILKLTEPLPLMFRHERRLAAHLANHPGDYVGALQQIPEQITLWMYALSSIMFNQYLSNCLTRGEEPPEEMPFFLSHERAAYEPYRDMLENLGLYPPRFQNLKPFPQVLIKSRYARTKDHADIQKAEVVDEGVVLQFQLGKGQYATTFLSHLFNLVGGKLSGEFAKTRVDSKAILGEGSAADVLQNFSEVIKPKGENIFEQFGAE
jgi:tRNA(Glu) U13 pseudouridine synthase TruD